MMGKPPASIRTENSALLVVDLQEKLLPRIEHHEAILAASGRLIDVARLLAIPLLVTEQYPKGLGRTDHGLREKLGEAPIVEKVRFSACVQAVTDLLNDAGRPHIAVCGVEAHVCVQQSVLDLVRLGYQPCVCVDAIGSRRRLDFDWSLRRMSDAGAILTTSESLIFEWLGEAGTDAFRRILPLVK